MFVDDMCVCDAFYVVCEVLNLLEFFVGFSVLCLSVISMCFRGGFDWNVWL